MGALATIRRWLRPRDEPVILMYHRVATPRFDPWGLAVSPANFEDQMRALKARRTMMPLDQFRAGAAAGSLPRGAVAVTFDDGYVDNLTQALPALKRQGAPATVFVSTGFTGAKVEFWWDELARLILGHQGAVGASTIIAGETVALSLPAGSPASVRESLYADVWQRLQGLSQAARDVAMADLRAVFGAGEAEPSDLPMDAAQLAALAGEDLITLGAHSISHPKLADLSAADLAAEIGESRRACEAVTGGAVEGFAYPFGNLNAAAKDAVRAAGFAFACTTESRAVGRSPCDPFALPRIATANESGEALLRRLEAL